ncbi:MAG: SAM-dependent chlorinase/fluorinase [Rhodospirillales bacterium]|nr:SAM-dependent chlorinase/fluorinase [Rhodospirillales bacterium]
MIVLFTDFGMTGPYLGQMKAVLRRGAPEVDIIDLFADAPAHDPKAAAYLLPAYVTEFPPGTVFLCVVDPGVGGARRPVVVNADDRWFVGPDNGLFELVMRRANSKARCWTITWRPERISASFHGRDLFAPVAARLARDPAPVGEELHAACVRRDHWPDDLASIIYIDVFGNVMTGFRFSSLATTAAVTIAGQRLSYAEVFERVPVGDMFWYGNANGLVELAANRARASDRLGVKIGDAVVIESGATIRH